MTRQRRQLLNLFQQNTGRTTMRVPGMGDPSRIEIVGYQESRVRKFKWQGKVE